MDAGIVTELRLIELFIFINTILLGVVGFFLKRAINKLDTLSIHKEDCLREFAAKDETSELYGISRKHGERISSLESWRQACEVKKC